MASYWIHIELHIELILNFISWTSSFDFFLLNFGELEAGQVSRGGNQCRGDFGDTARAPGNIGTGADLCNESSLKSFCLGAFWLDYNWLYTFEHLIKIWLRNFHRSWCVAGCLTSLVHTGVHTDSDQQSTELQTEQRKHTFDAMLAGQQDALL